MLPSKHALTEIGNISKTLSASIDISAAFRQGLGAIGSKAYWQNLNALVKVSDKAYEGVMESIHTHPMYEDAINHGLKLTELGDDYTTREEAFMSQLVGNLPGIKHSARSMTAFLDKVRMDMYADLIDKAGKAGEELNIPFKAKLAEYVNNATGRGSLPNTKLTGNMEQNAVMLNNLFFSPRLIASRVKMLNPATYIAEQNPFIRKQYLKSALAIASFGIGTTQLGKVAAKAYWPNKDVDISADPSSSDFGKLKIGDTRFDPYGGHQQYIVAAVRLLQELNQQYGNGGLPVANKQKFGTRTGSDVLGSFAEQKLSPLASFVTTIARGKDFQGQPADLREEALKRFIPMMIQDLIAVGQEDPDLLPLSALSGTGIGVQSYGSKHEQQPKLLNAPGQFMDWLRRK